MFSNARRSAQPALLSPYGSFNRLVAKGTAQVVAGWLVFVLPFTALLVWFRVADVYHTQFFTPHASWTYLVYNSFRTLYSLYLIWLLYSVGAVLLRALEKRGVYLNLGLSGEVVLCFYAGAAIVAAVGFLLGCFQLYYFWILAPVTLLWLAASYPSFTALAVRVRACCGAAWDQEKDAVQAGAKVLAVAAAASLAVLLLVMKALPPGGTGDYYFHYFPYYKNVVNSHGLAPNDVWYHFYISKGSSLLFWSAVLTDLQAPEIVTYAFVLVAGLTVYSIVRQWRGSFALATAAAGTYLAALVFTFDGRDPAPWGDFQKQHEQTGSLLVSLAWLVLVMPSCAGTALRAWALFAALFAASVVLFTPTAYPLVLALLALGTLGWAVRKQWRMLKCFASAAAAATAILACLLALNYAITGLAEVTPMRFFWRHADQERFSRIWSPYLMVTLEEGSSPGMGDAKLTLPAATSLVYFAKALIRFRHLSRFFPGGWEGSRNVALCIAGLWLMVGVFLLRGWRPRFDLARALLLIVGFLGASILLANFSGQHISAFRYFTFTIYFTHLFAVLTWLVVLDLLPSSALCRRLASIAPVLYICWSAFATPAAIPATERTHCLSFALGHQSLADGYAFRDALFGPVRRAADCLPPDAPLYSFNVDHSCRACMAPNCEMKTFMSYALGKDWHTILFESPEEAQERLEAQGLNYFFIDLNGRIEDILQYSPLFSADNIGIYFEVAWSEGDAYLLTWSGRGTHPLPESCLALYRRPPHMVDLWPLYARVQTIYEANKGRPYPIYRDPTLPPVRGWQ